MSEQVSVLKLRSEPVPWFGLFFSWIAMLLGIERPELRRTVIDLVPGDLPTVPAVAEGEADMGITTPPACATMAYRGVGPYHKKMENLRAIANFPHDDRMVWAVPAEWGVSSIEELRGRKLRFAVPGPISPVGFAVEKILEAYDMPLERMAAGGWELLREDYLFKVISLGIEGKADMVVHEGRKTPPWARFASQRKLTFLPVREDILDRMVEQYGFRKAILSKGMLDGAVKKDTPTLDWSGWLLFTRDDVNENLVYDVTRIIVERKHLFEMSFKGQPLEHSDLVYPMEPAALLENLGVPLHPGAERYFRDNGHLS
jgi:hypothetical protein